MPPDVVQGVPVQLEVTHGHDDAPSPSTSGDATVRTKSGMRGNSGLLQSPGVSEEEAIQMAIYTSQLHDRQLQSSEQPCAGECDATSIASRPVQIIASPNR